MMAKQWLRPRKRLRVVEDSDDEGDLATLVCCTSSLTPEPVLQNSSRSSIKRVKTKSDESLSEDDDPKDVEGISKYRMQMLYSHIYLPCMTCPKSSFLGLFPVPEISEKDALQDLLVSTHVNYFKHAIKLRFSSSGN